MGGERGEERTEGTPSVPGAEITSGAQSSGRWDGGKPEQQTRTADTVTCLFVCFFFVYVHFFLLLPSLYERKRQKKKKKTMECTKEPEQVDECHACVISAGQTRKHAYCSPSFFLFFCNITGCPQSLHHSQEPETATTPSRLCAEKMPYIRSSFSYERPVCHHDLCYHAAC